nr:hypothetical protein [Tanacetum cinerariifolium]
SEETTALSEVSRATMSKKPGHVQPINYDKLNSLYSQFVPQKELSREQVYWQSPADVSPPTTPVKPFVKPRPAPSQVREKLECIKKTFPGFEKLVKDNYVVRPLHVTEAVFERIKMIFEGQITPFFECPPTTPVKPFVKPRPAPSQVREKLVCIKKTFPGFEKLVKDNSVVRPLHVTEAAFERIKMIFEGQITPFFEWYKQRVLEFDDAIVKEVSEYKRIFYELETKYENTLLAKKKLQIANKNLLIQNDTLLANGIQNEVCAIVLTVLKLEAQVLETQKMLSNSNSQCTILEKHYNDLQLKFQRYKENLKNQRILDNSNAMASNAIFEITLLKDQLRERDETVRNLQSEINISKLLNLGGNDDSTASSVNVQALETKLCQLKDTITSLRIEHDALKVTNTNVHRCNKELTLANTYLRNSSVETIKAQKAEIASLKAKHVGKPSSRTTKPANPKVIALGMYAVNPTEPPSTTRITSKPDTAIKQPNVSVPLSTGVKPASGASKPGPKSNAWIYRRVNVQALETELCQLKDTITSIRIEHDALKVTNANVHRCNKELTLANTYLRNSSVETIKAQKAKIATLKAKRVGKPSSRTTKPANPKVITPGMYAVNPTEPSSTTRITSKPDTAIKQPNVSVPLSTRVKPASGANKPGPKSNAWIYRRLPARSKRGEKVEAHLRTLNKQNHVDSSFKRTVSMKNAGCDVCYRCLNFDSYDNSVFNSMNS